MNRSAEAGYVLAAALAALLAMSLVAAALVAATVGEVRRVAAAERAAADDAALDGALMLAAAELAREPRLRSLDLEDEHAEVAIAGRAIEVAVGWESDKLDLNVAGLDAVDAALRAHDASGLDRAAVRRALEVGRASGIRVQLVDDVLGDAINDECIRRILTVFGGRSDWTAEGERETIGVGVPAPGARVWVAAEIRDGAVVRGREAVMLFTGDPAAPVRVMDLRSLRGGREEACDGA